MEKHVTIEGRNGKKIKKHIRYNSEEELKKKIKQIKDENTKVPKLKDVIDEWQDSIYLGFKVLPLWNHI